MDGKNSNVRTTAGVIAASVLIAMVALLVLVALTGSICAAGDENAGGSKGEVTEAAVSAASVTTSINYQGRLTDSSGSPLSGTYVITFRLYDVSTGGTALAMDTHDVDVADGLFNTGIDFGTSYFDGRELWLGVTIGTDSEMTPRQELRPVPYAMSLVPGADIIGSALVALHAESTHTSGRGIRGYATATSGTNYGMVGASKSPDGYGGYFYNNGGGIGMYGKGGEYGGFFTTDRGGTGGLYPVHNAAVNATTTHDYSDGVYTKTTGHGSAGVRASTTGGNSPGFYASTTGDKSWGVRVDTSGDESHGVCARTDGSDSDGVWAYSVNHYGVFGRSDSTDSAGVYARGKDSGADLVLGGNADTTVGDDGKIYSDQAYDSSDICLISNDNIRIDLNNDGNDEDADFEIYDKDNTLIFNVDDSGTTTV
ncbi:MAG TPA: hypothetical protein EYP67_04665, partial [Methanosarcinales archaeon]|nr:hypothetical protein [Methanosarcinales archaeon]